MSQKNSQDQVLEQIVNLMQRDDSFDAPQDAVQWSKNIFRSRAAVPQKSFVKKVLAVLQMDLSPNRAAFGERSAAAGQARQILFQAGDAAIDLRVKSEENGFSVRGQILGADFSGSTIILGDSQMQVSELGEFKFTEIPNGKYDMLLQKGELEIIVENLQFD